MHQFFARRANIGVFYFPKISCHNPLCQTIPNFMPLAEYDPLHTSIADRMQQTNIFRENGTNMDTFIVKNNKSLRFGYTTGSCAAGAAKAATELLLHGRTKERISIVTPNGTILLLPAEETKSDGQVASCCIRKDSGDDPDVTNGIKIYATVRKTNEHNQIRIDGGTGVGRVTKPGLACAIGEAAINPTPKRMIQAEAIKMAELYDYHGGLDIVISIPEGVEIAKRTFNPRLGIEGGISVLGTTGIVEPMSEQALIDSIKTEMNVLRAQGYSRMIVSPGNYGSLFSKMDMNIHAENAIQCSNFIGETLDHAAVCGFKELLFIGHIGKFVKLAGGIMNTHSRYADCRMELIAAHTALAGGSQTLINKLMECVTTDEAVSLLKANGLNEIVMRSLIGRIDFYLNNRTYGNIHTQTVMFSNQHGILAKTDGADELLRRIQTEGKK